jgi:hypothetical protein
LIHDRQRARRRRRDAHGSGQMSDPPGRRL